MPVGPGQGAELIGVTPTHGPIVRDHGWVVASRSTALADRLQRAVDDLIGVIGGVDLRRWREIPVSGGWSIGKEAEHVAEAAAYHRWIVRRTIGGATEARPAIERTRQTSDLSPSEAVTRIRESGDDGVRLILGLTDDQLDLPTTPRRARHGRLGETIEHVLVAHVEGHRRYIEARLERARRSGPGQSS
jgi:uncharacterized damage-inducible protein DinB